MVEGDLQDTVRVSESDVLFDPHLLLALYKGHLLCASHSVTMIWIVTLKNIRFSRGVDLSLSNLAVTCLYIGSKRFTASSPVALFHFVIHPLGSFPFYPVSVPMQGALLAPRF